MGQNAAEILATKIRQKVVDPDQALALQYEGMGSIWYGRMAAAKRIGRNGHLLMLLLIRQSIKSVRMAPVV